MVTIFCPETGQKVATGLSMDEEEFARLGTQVNVLRCPACGRTHQWTKAQADLQPDPPRGLSP